MYYVIGNVLETSHWSTLVSAFNPLTEVLWVRCCSSYFRDMEAQNHRYHSQQDTEAGFGIKSLARELVPGNCYGIEVCISVCAVSADQEPHLICLLIVFLVLDSLWFLEHFFLFCFWATSISAQGLLLFLCSEDTMEIKPKLVMCKTSASVAVLSFWPLLGTFLMNDW